MHQIPMSTASEMPAAEPLEGMEYDADNMVQDGMAAHPQRSVTDGADQGCPHEE